MIGLYFFDSLRINLCIKGLVYIVIIRIEI